MSSTKQHSMSLLRFVCLYFDEECVPTPLLVLRVQSCKLPVQALTIPLPPQDHYPTMLRSSTPYECIFYPPFGCGPNCSQCIKATSARARSTICGLGSTKSGFSPTYGCDRHPEWRCHSASVCSHRCSPTPRDG